MILPFCSEQRGPWWNAVLFSCCEFVLVGQEVLVSILLVEEKGTSVIVRPHPLRGVCRRTGTTVKSARQSLGDHHRGTPSSVIDIVSILDLGICHLKAITASTEETAQANKTFFYSPPT